MATAEALKQQLSTTEELHSVVRTMKSMAAVNIRQYEQAVQSLKDYTAAVTLGLKAVLPHVRQRRREEKLAGAPTGMVFFGTDQGMCGQLNEDVARLGLENMRELKLDGQPRLLAVGERMAGQLADEDLEVDEVISVPASVHGIGAKVQSVLMRIDDWQQEHGVRRAYLFHARMTSRAAYSPATLRLLPFDENRFLGGHDADWPERSVPLHTMETQDLFRALVRQYLHIGVFQALAQSLASENSSRLAAMQGAEKNIEDRLAELRSQYNQTRQMTITSELLDIVTGFTALEGEDGPKPELQVTGRAGLSLFF